MCSTDVGSTVRKERLGVDLTEQTFRSTRCWNAEEERKESLIVNSTVLPTIRDTSVPPLQCPRESCLYLCTKTVYFMYESVVMRVARDA